ncbi:MAG: 4-hydroxy-tetrahydrodipicolinate reductase [Candidatus Aureabacteria bacterium]|nr:4-hydroxy-tetrahydrodipicolinate reductase [Candidatus Auribacterota bacterium]
MKKKLGIIGCCGRMGQAIARLAEEGDIFELSAVIEAAKHPCMGQSYRHLTHSEKPDLKITSDIEALSENPDVLIDFSHHDTTLLHLEKAAKKKIPYVIGTTGITEKELAKISILAKKIPILYSPNMSLGMNVVLLAAELLAKKLGDLYDMEIIEAHHNKKADSPSGTALKLFEVVRKALHRDENCGVYGRKGMIGKRTPKEIGIHAVRGGDIIGEHRLLLAGQGEQIELFHRVQSRDTFAHGALKGAEFLIGKTPGLYDMKAVLGLS